jgi:DNA ligase-1
MGNSTWSDERFIANRKYKALCVIMTPNGIVKEGTVLTTEEWKEVLVFGIGHDFDGMFELVDETNKNNNMKEFPKLFKKTTTGAIQEWTVSVDEINGIPTIINRFGQVGGKIQYSHEQVLSGKNTGRANATTAMEQAEAQAKSRWEKQLKKGYVQNIEDAQAGVVDAIIEGGIAPMLAHKFSEQGHKIKYPALAQPKLDGHRCTSQNMTSLLHHISENGNEITLWSRTRKPITSCPHIIEALKYISIPRLDGELYNHDYHNNFEELSSLIRQEEPKEGYEKIQYHVYDMPSSNMTNIERNEILQSFKKGFEGTPIHIVETIVVNDEDELMVAFEHFLAEGYEGCMVRNADGIYVNKRSYDLQKIKEFDDSEFKIIGIKVGTKGSMAGKAVFTCDIPNVGTFDVKLKGNMDDLKTYADDPSLVIGKILTVKYQGFTKYGFPRFPVGLRFREDL